MADFCKQCSIEMFGKDYMELANLGPVDTLTPGEGWVALCESCGHTVVAQDGTCIADWCPLHGTTAGENDNDIPSISLRR